ncbi:MAG: helix-turn-helix transcriptional regulator [Bacteroidota bacterium]
MNLKSVLLNYKFMPKNKNASFRYRVLDNCFRNTGRKYSLEDLIEVVSDEMYEHFGIDKGISKRTIQGDINIMRSEPPRGFGAPIINEDGYYRYENPKFTISENPFNTTDLKSLKEAIQILKQFTHLPVYKELKSLVEKVEEGVTISDAFTFIDLEKNTHYHQLELLTNIYVLFEKKKQISFKYKPFESSEIKAFILHPLLIKEYRNRWFVIGWNNDFSGYTVLPFDRIVDFEELNDDAEFGHKQELNKIYNSLIGVSIPPDYVIEKVELFISKNSKNYIKTKPIHSSQKIIHEDNTGMLVELELIINFELKQLILSHLPNIKVIKPITLKNTIEEDIKSAMERYKN